jgi:uncharacterized membrane protein
VSGKPSRAEREAAERAQEVAQRAIRRLDLLEGVLIAGGALLALALGALVAWVLAGIAGTPFRPVWMVASLVLFVVPGVLAIMRIRREEAADQRRTAQLRENDED